MFYENEYNRQTKSRTTSNKSAKRPENKDNLDSREGEEQSDKGGDVTHNKKDKHGELKHKNKSNQCLYLRTINNN